MKLLFIRHGDPSYENDSLTPQGVKEARCLAAKLVKTHIDKIYVSPLGRAKKTAKYYFDASGRSADAILDWLQEFRGRCERPDRDGESICWDWLPQDWMSFTPFYDKDHWFEHPVFKDTNVKSEYDYVTAEFDKLLAENGYRRNGAAEFSTATEDIKDANEVNTVKKRGRGRKKKLLDGAYYRAEQPNNMTIAFFCHFGIEAVFLSHLLGISPMVLWHTTVAAPSSVTTVVTEERREGIASWRMQSYGDLSHLYAFGVEPAFAARFCECWKNEDERHD
ncbi:MAG: histidine phosphatase family protein [Lachnospiraceae bacterium]|nr:histidine phosphatase family protein [Lachnospiraceae bacterium]